MYVIYATVMLIIYPVGVPLLQFFLLRFKYREPLEHIQTLNRIHEHESKHEGVAARLSACTLYRP